MHVLESDFALRLGSVPWLLTALLFGDSPLLLLLLCPPVATELLFLLALAATAPEEDGLAAEAKGFLADVAVEDDELDLPFKLWKDFLIDSEVLLRALAEVVVAAGLSELFESTCFDI